MELGPPRRIRVPLILGLWTVLGIVASGQLYLLMRIEGPAVSLGRAALMQLPGWLFWAPVTPLILRLGLRPPLERAWTARRLLPQAGVALALSLLHSLLVSSLYVWFYPARTPSTLAQVFPGYLHTRLLFDLLIYAAILSVGYAVEYHDRFRARALEASRLEAELAQSELHALRMQLQPHFLFNTLNTISILTETDPRTARTMLGQLGDLLRATLEHAGAQEVRLGQEVEFLRSYLAIERTRFSDRLRVQLDLDPATLPAWVPNLVLQPLVENAIRYAIAPRAAAGSLTVGSTQVDGRLELRVEDDGPGFGRSTVPSGAGVGISNTRARLERLYGPRASVSTEDRPGGGSVVTISLPFHTGPTPLHG